MVVSNQKQRKSSWKNIQLWLILSIETVGLIGFVGETNYHFVERLIFLRLLRHNLNLEFRNTKLLRERKRGTFALRDIANIDQTPLPFVLDDGRTYDDKGSEEVWFSSNKSSFDKRQSTIQLTIFADAIPRR